MMDPSLPYATLLLLPMALVANVGAYVWSRRSVPIARTMLVLVAAVLVWLVGYQLQLLSTSLDAMLPAVRLAFVGILALPGAVLVLALQVTHRERWLTPGTLLLIFAPPAAVWIAVLTNDVHHWMWTSYRLSATYPPRFSPVRGPLFPFYLAQTYGMLAIALGLLASHYARAWRTHRAEALAVLGGIVLPVTTSVIDVSRTYPLNGLALTPIAFAFTALAFAWGVLHRGLWSLGPVARSKIIDRMEDGMLVVDAEGRAVDANAAAIRLLARTGGVVTGQPARELLAPWPDLLELARASVTDLELQLGDPSRGYHVKASPLTDQRGERTGTLLMFHDITASKQVESELRLARDRAEAATRAKSEFLANMSHELRTPMNGVIGMASILADTKLDPEQRDCVRTLSSSAETLLKLLNDVLDLSKIEAGHVSLEATEVRLEALVGEVLALLDVQARAKRVELVGRVRQDVPPVVIGDPVRLRQILLNLASNAIKFTAQGAVTIRLACDAREPLGVTLRIEVQDTGIGIEADALDRIFDKFTQADASTTRRFGGTGLGLTITRDLVERMGGSIAVESTIGTGSTFRILVPLALPQPGREAAAVAAPLVVRQGLRILLAEDNPVNQKVAVRMLERDGCQVDVASNGREAVEMQRWRSYDLILMDCQMPDLDGLEATRAIRAGEPPGRRIPVIALTANALSTDRDLCLAAGMDDYVSKPIQRDVLRAVLARRCPAA